MAAKGGGGGEAEALKEQDATSRLEAAAVDVLGLPEHGDCSPAPAPAAMVRGCRSGMPGSPEHGVAAQEASFRSEATLAPKSTARQQLGGAGGCYYYRKRRDPKRRAARSSKAAASAKRSSNRDLPDQLEAHARRLLMDAGWRIKPRIRNDRPKAAYYFTAPQEEAVLASLSQAWRLCGQRLRSASGGLESEHQFPAEWSDIDQFWKDLVDAMDSVRNMAVDGSATLLRRWQLLDPFVAVVFIDKRITALQKQKKIRAVDSSTCFVDYYGDNRPSTDKPTTTTSPCSGYSRVATDVCDGHQDMVTKDTGVSGQAENHIQSNAGPAHSGSGANLDNSLVKRLRKKPRWLSDFESTGLNGLYAQSFMQSSVPLSESGSCSVGNGTLKKHLKSRNESMPSESNGCSVAKSTVTESDADASAKKQQSRLPKKSPARGLSEDVVTVSDVSNVVVKSCQKHNATVVECSTSLEAQSHKEPTIASKSEIFEKQAKKRPFEMHFNDDDLLITAIVKKRDISSCQKNELRLVSSNAKFRKLKSSKKDSRLLIRKGGTDVLDGRQIVLARKTVLCWLIATGFMTLKDVVQCRNPENNEVLKDGWVTWDGILCSCCIKTLSISDFKAHAMISLPRSSLNLCLQSGKSLTLCQIEAWNAEYMDRRSNACSRKVEAADENDDTCGFCGDGGELLCCDNCPSTYHQSCLSVKELPDDSWYCHNCICRICGCPISEKEISSFSAILKCLQCGAAHHDTCVEMGATAFEEMDSDEWFCGTSCKEIYLGLHGCVGVESSLRDGLSWTILRCNSGGQKLHSIQKIAHVIECNLKLAVALTLMEECFAKMVDTRTGIDMIPHVMYNQGSKYARLNYQGFYTVILEKGEEILCAASIRVHGMKAAELPFIATCREHRRKGMCRRLINTIEEMLKSFHVKMLVLSAIPELVSTWVSGFGFKPIEEYERKQLDTINLMLFPGTSLLIKSLEDGTLTEKSGAGNDAYDVLGLPDDYCIPNGSDNEHFEEVGSDFIVRQGEASSRSQQLDFMHHVPKVLLYGELFPVQLQMYSERLIGVHLRGMQ
ncbi:increased DNA methylation 1-like isoform X2 [Miscanthus floridulus]|uniref:increased DNA methylation 1-like isoform X2 n=1 Tax=Miscanthus floridulus TaxID=154761 RepID=UPI00345802D5